METLRLTLHVLSERLAVCRLPADARLPAWATNAPFFSLIRTSDELSVVCPDTCVPADIRCERGWRALRFVGALDFALVGVLVAVAVPLAEAGVSIFALSTYDTDYVLVRETQLADAVAVLERAGHTLLRKLPSLANGGVE